MENLFFLVLTAIILAIAILSLFSYIRDRKKLKSMFTKKK
ncbi:MULTISPECIES: small membrane protein [Klebsiella]|nr:small membrane protein [Klebsiella aerogenes]EIV3802317.1 small membrane protein [Klebsiella aerogenes]EIV7213127.1 small membrane protein [Klebsiella aerogenes]EKZ5286329.1 small membrane protein [Klebsiella aerogenes]EKZ5300453.1 small membrane protein [Klebsiella aerogenes]MEC5621583.1 small membrane protein [Klebsiella aerogenes]